MQYILFICALLGQCLRCDSAKGDSKRAKRIIGGQTDIDSERSYSSLKVLQYYVWIGLAHECHEDAGWWRRAWDRVSGAFYRNSVVNQVCPFEKPKRLVCGGALIAPKIVQTACHCVAAMESDGYREWGGFNIYTNLEDDLFVYMGRSEVRNFYYPIKSSQFAAHEKCGQLQRPPYNYRYDIGWIVLEDKVPEARGVLKSWWYPLLDYAGPYRQAELEKFSDRVTEYRQVCLVGGFGRTEEEGSASRVFRFGWIQILDFYHCFEALWKSRGFDVFLPYHESASWVCSQPLNMDSRLGALHWDGDSGSPITCNSIYFAVVSAHSSFSPMRAGFTEMSTETAIRHAPEANTVERRRLFEAKFYLFGRYNSLESLMVLKFPNGSIKFPWLRRRNLDFAHVPRQSHSLQTSFSDKRHVQSTWMSTTLAGSSLIITMQNYP